MEDLHGHISLSRKDKGMKIRGLQLHDDWNSSYRLNLTMTGLLKVWIELEKSSCTTWKMWLLFKFLPHVN